MPKVSVIIPTYNRQSIVHLSIASVLNQSYEDYELIVVDDGSTDNTEEALKGVRDRIRYIYQENHGVSGAINTGIRAAGGQWIAILGSDDEWLENYLQWQMQQVEDHKEVIAHITNAVTLKPGGKEENHFQGTGLLQKFGSQPCLMLTRPLTTILEYGPWFTQSTVMRRDILLQSGLFNPELSIAEDLDAMARLSLKGAFRICREVLVHIYRREETKEYLSQQVVFNGIRTRETMREVLKGIRREGTFTEHEKRIWKKVLSENERALGNCLLKGGYKKDAKEAYKKAVVLYPSLKSIARYIVSYLPKNASIRLIRKGKYIEPGSR